MFKNLDIKKLSFKEMLKKTLSFLCFVIISSTLLGLLSYIINGLVGFFLRLL